MIPACSLQDLNVVNRGEDSCFEWEDRDLSVNTPCIKCTVCEVIAPAFVEVRGQVHEFAGFGKCLDIECCVKDAEVRSTARGDRGADLVTVSLVIGLLFNDNFNGAGILGIEGFNHLGHVGGFGVRSDPDAREIDDDFAVCRSRNCKSSQGKAESKCQNQCEQFLHVVFSFN